MAAKVSIERELRTHDVIVRSAITAGTKRVKGDNKSFSVYEPGKTSGQVRDTIKKLVAGGGHSRK